MKASVVNYHDESNVDFLVEIGLTGDRTADIFVQPEIEDGEIVKISTPDSQDDVEIVNPELHDDMIDAMQEALDEYHRPLPGNDYATVKWDAKKESFEYGGRTFSPGKISDWETDTEPSGFYRTPAVHGFVTDEYNNEYHVIWSWIDDEQEIDPDRGPDYDNNIDWEHPAIWES